MTEFGNLYTQNLDVLLVIIYKALMKYDLEMEQIKVYYD